MALDSIREKLGEYLAKDIPINNEAEALYFLVEVGKILERDENRNFPLLKFFRDWACHPRKDKMIGEILEIVQAVYKDATNQMQSPFGISKPVAILDLTNGDYLKKQMGLFLKQYGLVGDGLLSEKNWNWFASMICNVLAEQPLYPQDGHIEYLEFSPVVEGAVGVKIVFTKPEQGSNGQRHGDYSFVNYLGTPDER